MLFCCPFQVDKGVEHRAAHTLPDGLWIRSSSIPNAGHGVFSTEFIPKGTRFGPYDGVIESNYEKAHSTGYSWQVNTTMCNNNINNTLFHTIVHMDNKK